MSASEYANHVSPPRNDDVMLFWQWCHLVAASMGGGGGPTIEPFAARAGNNTEQMAIENTLWMYRSEKVFSLRVSAARDGDTGSDREYIGNVIKYEIQCDDVEDQWVMYLHCLHAPNVSAIHYDAVVDDVACWANYQLLRRSEELYKRKVPSDMKNLIKNDMANQ